MTLALRESGNVLRGVVEYNTDLFSRPRVQRLIGHYEQLLTAMVNNPQQRVSELPLLTETEQQLLQGFNDTARALPQDLYAHQLFEAQVARTPEAVALVHEDEQLSYAELNGRANQLAHYLRGNGVGLETFVGVCLPRGVNQTVALLAVLKSGAAYLPLEPGYTSERLAAMLEETGATLVLTEAGLLKSLPTGVRQLLLETVQPELVQLPPSDVQLEVAPESLAYFTQSLAITHAGLLAAVQSSTEMLDLTASDRVLELSSPARDAHLLTVFATLLRGATLTLSAREANVLSAPVARFVELRREQDLSALSTVILYGDSMSPRLLDSLPGKRFVHVRELPNATLFQLSHEYNQTEQWPTLIPYERGSQVEFYVLDKAFQPVPMGVTG
jgi:non-ribosomal peptide synthetase component F